jgi:hypothetical protein
MGTMIRPRRFIPLFRATLALAISLGAACGGGAAGDQASKLTGTWKFQSGMLTPACGGGLSVPPFPLTGLSLTLTKVDDSTIQVVAGSAGCTLTFKVAGNVATATSGQTCMLDAGATLGGVQTISVKSWTLTLANDQLTTSISAGIIICTATGDGVLVRSTPDGGAD